VAATMAARAPRIGPVWVERHASSRRNRSIVPVTGEKIPGAGQ
jgi:hypothetical protein